METIKLIAMDMDGTLLLDGGKGIPQENIAALHEAHQAGIHLALCSGRVPDDMGFYALDAGVPMHILALNGTCMLDAPLGTIIRSDCIADGAARMIVDLIQQHHVHYGVFSGHDLLISTPMTESMLNLIFGDNILRQGARTRVGYDLSCVEAILAKGVNKFMIFSESDPQALMDIRAQIEARLPQVEVSSSWHNNLEVNPVGANKGVALRALSETLGIPISQVMAIGDNDNDLPMLEAAGVSVAMGNASPAVKACAGYHTLPNHECGVAAAIRAIALGREHPGVVKQS